MPQLNNKKQELFARFLADGTNTQADAYTLAGYNPSTSNASVLANQEHVKARIKELQEEHERKELEFRCRVAEAKLDPEDPEKAVAEVRDWDADRVRNLLAENARLAQTAGEWRASKESLELIGKSLGMFESSTPTGKSNGNEKGAQVALTLINEVSRGTSGEGGTVLEGGRNPLAPRLSRAGPTLTE